VGNLRFISTKLDQITFTSSVGDDAGFPAANLNTGFHDDLWKSLNSNANQYLTIDTGTDIRVRTGLVLHNHNLAGIMATGNMQLQSATNAGFSSGLVQAINPLAVTTDPFFVNFGGAVNQRYWRILFGGTLSAVPQIGQVFVDQVVDLGAASTLPYVPRVDEHRVTKTESLDGRIRAASPFGARKIFRFSLKEGNSISDAVRAVWQTVFAVAGGGLRPTYLIDDADAIWLGVFDFDTDTLQKFRYNAFPLEISFRAQRVS